MTKESNPPQQGEFSDAELSYRRGLQDGAHFVLSEQDAGVSAKEIWEEVYIKMHRWRTEGMREFYAHGKVERTAAPVWRTRGQLR